VMDEIAGGVAFGDIEVGIAVYLNLIAQGY
jgi:hypothetical protein